MTTDLVREVRINGRYLRLADVLTWAAKQDQEITDAEMLVGYLYHREAIDRCGRGGVTVNSRVNTWSRDGRNEDIEVTVGIPLPPDSSGTRWVSCQQWWFYRRASEIEPAARALDLYRRYREAERELHAEYVEVPTANPGGAGVIIEKFWIAYPPHVAGYADEFARVSQSYGRGKTKGEALLRAATRHMATS